MEDFNQQKFIDKQLEEIKKAIGKRRALIAVSGGVDSVTSAVLTHRAIGKNLLCVMLDDAFMRENEPQQIAHIVFFSVSSRPTDRPGRTCAGGCPVRK